MNFKKRHGCAIDTHTIEESALVGIGDMEIWDGADLALLRDMLTKVIAQDGYHKIAIDLSSVKYLPSGFFGMLFELYEQGIKVQLYRPQTIVQNFLWFKMFFFAGIKADDIFILTDEEYQGNSPLEQVEVHRRRFHMQDNDDETNDDEDAKELMRKFQADLLRTSNQ